MAPSGGYDVSIKTALLALSLNFITSSDDVSATLGRVTASAIDPINGVGPGRLVRFSVPHQEPAQSQHQTGAGTNLRPVLKQ